MNMDTVMTAALSAWLLQEIQQRDMSVREFGRFANIPHSTLNKLLNWESQGVTFPALETIVQLSRATNTDICALVAMLVPEQTLTDGEALVLANRIRNLPPEGREIVEQWLTGRLFKRSNKLD